MARNKKLLCAHSPPEHIRAKFLIFTKMSGPMYVRVAARDRKDQFLASQWCGVGPGCRRRRRRHGQGFGFGFVGILLHFVDGVGCGSPIETKVSTIWSEVPAKSLLRPPTYFWRAQSIPPTTYNRLQAPSKVHEV